MVRPQPGPPPPTMASSRVPGGRSRLRGRQGSAESGGRETSPPPPAPPPPQPALACNGDSKGPKDFSLDDFDFKNVLGTGTFGRVVLVHHRAGAHFYALKVLSIRDVIRLEQVQHVRNEKAVLQQAKHPFIVDMLWTHHNDRFLYMLLEFICGGELFSYLRNAGRFTNSASNFYAAEIVSALDYLHARNIVYRDLKPENLLLDKEGHLKLTDFGFAKRLDDRTWTLCGTPEYLAPEIIQCKGHNKAVDWWALGILIFEMIVGYPPYFDDNAFAIYEKILAAKIDWPQSIDKRANYPPFFDNTPIGIYKRILAGAIEWPAHLKPAAKDLIRKLLVQDRTRRLGNMKNGAEDVKRHKWFRDLEWSDVVRRKLTPPVVPRVRHGGDTRNFFEYPEQQPPNVPDVKHAGDASNFDEFPDDAWQREKPAATKDASLFEDF